MANAFPQQLGTAARAAVLCALAVAALGCAAGQTTPCNQPETYSPGAAVDPAPAPAPTPAVHKPAAPPTPTELPVTVDGDLPACPIFDPFDAEERLRRALEPLMLGNVEQGRRELLLALCQAPEDENARSLLWQMDVAPEKALGNEFFAYRVTDGDSLPGIAKRFLGDPYRFYILARYNNLEKPADLIVGQCLRVPGAADQPPTALAADLARCGLDLEAAGSPSLAYGYFARGLVLAPDHPVCRNGVERTAAAAVAEFRGQAVRGLRDQDLASARWNSQKALEIEPENEELLALHETADQIGHTLAALLYREAEAAYARRNREEAIANCGRVLELDPDHEKAGALLKASAALASATP